MAGEPEIVLCTMGTRGDFLPFLALAGELAARGHSVTLLANENWRDLAAGAGLRFHPIAPKDPTQSARDAYRFFVDNTLPSFTTSFEYVQGRVAAGAAPALVYRSNMLGMECAAEKFGLRHIKIALQPSAIKSFDRPPWPMTRLAQGRFRSLFRSVLIPGLYLVAEVTRRYRRHSNAFRLSHGLAPYRFGELAKRTENATLVLAPSWFALPQRDWPTNTHCVGFPFFDQEKHDPEIEEFAATHGKPIVFTPGTGVTDVRRFFAKAEAICDLSGMPGIFLCPSARTLGGTNPRILRKDFVDLAWLLRRARLLVHHGGIGTTAQALRAGLPQIIVPDRFDQPDNAFRVATLGLGAAVMRDDLSAESWAGIIRQQLSGERIRSNLARVSAAIRGERAMERAAGLVESIALDVPARTHIRRRDECRDGKRRRS